MNTRTDISRGKGFNIKCSFYLIHFWYVFKLFFAADSTVSKLNALSQHKIKIDLHCKLILVFFLLTERNGPFTENGKRTLLDFTIGGLLNHPYIVASYFVWTFSIVQLFVFLTFIWFGGGTRKRLKCTCRYFERTNTVVVQHVCRKNFWWNWGLLDTDSRNNFQVHK